MTAVLKYMKKFRPYLTDKSVSDIKTSRLIRFGEIITVYSENHTLHENTLCGQNTEIFNIKECRIYSNLGVYKSRVTKFWTMAPNICGYSVWNLLHVNLLSPRILEDSKFLKHFWAPSATTLPSRVNKYRRTPTSAGNTFQDLPRLHETADNTERGFRVTYINTVKLFDKLRTVRHYQH